MFNPAALFIGLRYTRAKRGNQFISLISLISTLGIALGITVLITVLSVLNGFDREIKKSVFDMMAPITINQPDGVIPHWQKMKAIVQVSPGITAVAPLVNGQALLQNSAMTQPVVLVGIIPSEEKTVSSLAQKLIEGDLQRLTARSQGLVIGERLATQLNVHLNDTITVMTPRSSTSIANITPHFETYHIAGIFRAPGGGLSFDSKLAFVHLTDAQKLFNLGNNITALHANIADIYTAPQIAMQLANELPLNLQVLNWTEQLGDFFENIKMTKTMMFFIFILIIIVAVFNLIASLIMIVNNKQADIAILRTMGATPRTIMAIFIVQGAMVGLIGTGLGILFGTLLACHVTGIINWIQTVFHIQLISANIYFVNYLPSELQWLDVWRISSIAFLLCLVGTIYPAWNASRMQPSEGLRE